MARHLSKRAAKSRAGASDVGTILRSAGLRKTAPRVAVLRFLERAKMAMSHGEIAEALASADLDRVTVYRNLLDLVSANLVSRTDLGDHVWRFALRRGEGDHAAEHPHFLCVSCGGVTCLPGAAMDLSGARGKPRALAARAVAIQLKGRCDTCVRA